MQLTRVRPSRPLLELLETRTVPALSSTALVADASGNFTATLVASNPTLNIAYDGASATLSLDDGGTPLVISGVTGNVTITARTTAAATLPFETTASFAGTFAGHFTLTATRGVSGASADTDLQLETTGPATILGNVRLTTNSPAESACTIIPAAGFPLTIAGSVSITTNGSGPGTSSIKTVNLAPQADLVIGGGFNASNMNLLTCSAGNGSITIHGSTVVRTRASSTYLNGAVLISPAPTNLVFQRLQIFLGNSGTGSSQVVTMANATINQSLTLSLGNNSGAATSATTLTGVQVHGALVSITGGNGSKSIDLTAVSAPLARLTVSLGNAPDNQVSFNGSSNAFLFTTLVGGTGTNNVSGLIPSPFKLIRFTFFMDVS